MRKKYIKKRRDVYAFLLSLPPLFALIMIGVLSFTSKSVVVAEEGLMLSPVKDSLPLIFALVIYIVWHSLFVGILFRKRIEKLYLKIRHKA